MLKHFKLLLWIFITREKLINMLTNYYTSHIDQCNVFINLCLMFQISKRVPNFTPETLFDFGSGVGSAIW